MANPPNNYNTDTNFNKFKGTYFNDDVEDVVDTEETTPSPQPTPRRSQYKSCPEVYPIKFGCKN